MEKMRVTAHNGRSGKSGTYSPKHNDRNFDIQNSPHINPEKSSGNWTWTCYKGLSFDDCEKKFYEQTFSKGLEEQNQRYVKNRHKERVRSINDYRRNPQTCPEETILQIGKSGDTVDPKMLQQVAIQLIAWEQKTFPNVQILDVALHVDEEGAPHMHERKVWIGHDKTGNAVVGQTKALLEMGISAPNPEKKHNRYNNPKITYTRMIREKLLDICREHGLEVEERPKEASRNGLSLEEYKTRQETSKLAEITNEIEKAKSKYDELQKLILTAKTELSELYRDYMSMSYRMEIVEDEGEGGFVVSYPDLPGCITCGNTVESAVANALDAKKAWIEAALEDGVEILIPDNIEDYSGQFKLRLPRSLHKSLAEHSRREGVSMNQYCVYLLSKNDILYSK